MANPPVFWEADRRPRHDRPVTDGAEIPMQAPSHDLLRYARQPLGAIFSPRNIAVIGATERAGHVGRAVLWNLMSTSFGGAVFPVNPKHPSVLGIKAYPSVLALPEPVDLAVIVTPAASVPGIVAECAQAGVRGVIIISAGFKECGAEGVDLEARILDQSRRARMRVVGPNCLGVMIPHQGLNATFAGAMARPGSVGFISQSGALGTAILDWSLRENIGFSAFISVGSMLDVGWGDLIDYLGDDPRTHSIVIYMESIGNAHAFLSAAREVALTKPIIVIKAGHTAAAAKAAASHTGALTGSDEVLDAAFRRCGVLRVNSIAELFYMAEVLGKQPRPRGRRLTILTNAGGPGVLAADALITSGGQLAELSRETVAALNPVLPQHWSHGNPVDILGDATPERYARALEIVAKDPNTDGLLVVLTLQAMTNATRTAEQLKPYAKIEGKPIIASWMGGREIAAGEEILNGLNIPTFSYPDTAARVFSSMWRYGENLRALYETPRPPADSTGNAPDRAAVQQIIKAARKARRTLLAEADSKQILAAYQIPTVETRVARSEKEAVLLAEEMGWPVVLKLFSDTLTHKTDVGGVQLNLGGKAAVQRAWRAIQTSVTVKAGAEHFRGVTVQPMIKFDGYEIILGSSIDPQFGPVIFFGAGGQLVEVFKDGALALPPLNTTLARRLMEQTRIFTALQGVRGRQPVNLPALEQLLVQFSHLIIEQRWIKEIDINPLLIGPERMVALDARVILHEPDLAEDHLPKPAIRPYPSQYVKPLKLRGLTPSTIRPIAPEDEPLLVKFHGTLTERSVYLRYFHMIHIDQRVSHERLTRICFNDYDREMALVIERKVPQTAGREILAIGRLSKAHHANEAQFALVVSDQWQKHGLGTQLLKSLLRVARDEKLERVTADILRENQGMRRVCEKLGFRLTPDTDGTTFKAEIRL